MALMVVTMRINKHTRMDASINQTGCHLRPQVSRATSITFTGKQRQEAQTR